MIKSINMKKRAIEIIILTSILSFICLVITLPKKILDFGLICPFYEILHLYCPGCGGTRMAVAILDGEFYQAFRYNPFAFTTAPFMGIIYIWQSYEYIFKNRLIAWLDKLLIIYAILLLIFGVIRNLSLFSYLAPVDI